MDVSANSNYHDFSGLAALRRDANANPDEAVAPVAKQFEALFLQMMLKSMRAGVPEGGLFTDESTKMYEDMLDSQLSVTLSDQGGIGMAESISKQILGKGNTASEGLTAEGAAVQARLQKLGGMERSAQDFSMAADKLLMK
jgi:flagellar protein FlgJ